MRSFTNEDLNGMKLTKAIVLVSIMSNAEYAFGHLRVASTTGATERRADDKREEDSTREKRQRMTVMVVDGTTMTTGDANRYHLLGIPSSQSRGEGTQNNNNIEVKIIGGEESDVMEFPYYVNMSGCGGTLIGPDVILGGAHCGTYLGSTVDIGGTRIAIIQEQMHPAYNYDTNENDFYLYKLISPLDISSSSGVTLTLNTDPSTPFPHQDLTVLGLGVMYEGGDLAPSLRDVVVPAISDSGCEHAYGSSYIGSVMFCAGEGGKDSCEGDSGGPIVIRNGGSHVLTGVVSWGIGCAERKYPGVYARVSSAIDWIRSVACDDWNSSVNGLCDNNGNSSTIPPDTPPPSSLANVIETEAPMDTNVTLLTVEFRTDDWPEETYILLRDENTTLQEYSNLEAKTDYSFSEYIPDDGCIVLDVIDTYGDGLLKGGFVKVTYGSTVMYDDSNLGSGFFMSFGNGCSP